MTTQSFLTMAGLQATLIRKPLQGVVLVAKYTDPALAALTSGATTANGIDSGVTTNHKTLGRITSEGVQFGNSISKQTTRGYGDTYPVRTDVESQDVTLSWTALETNLQTIDAFYGVTQVAAGLAATTKELIINAPALPVIRDRRVLAVFRDSAPDGSGDIYMGLYFLRANISQNGDQTYSFSDACLNYPLQATALMDDAAGTPYRLFWGGPGWQSYYGAMGYS